MQSTRIRKSVPPAPPARPSATPRQNPRAPVASAAARPRDRWLDSLRFDFRF